MKTNAPHSRPHARARLRTCHVVAIAGLLLGGLGAVTSQADILYVSNEGATNNAITKFASNGIGSIFPSSGVIQPFGIAFDSTGNLYVASLDNRIVKITPGGSVSTFASTPPGSTVFGIAFDDAGNLYVSNLFGGTILKFTPGGTSSVFAPGGSVIPSGLAFDSVGNLCTAKRSPQAGPPTRSACGSGRCVWG